MRILHKAARANSRYIPTCKTHVHMGRILYYHKYLHYSELNLDLSGFENCSSSMHLVRTYGALLYRYAQVFLRTNFLNVTLCLSLQQPYLLHYFVGLITYCYTVVTVTMTSWLALAQLFVTISKSVNERSRIAAFIIVLVVSTLFSAMLKTHKSLFKVMFFSKPLGWALQSVKGEWQARWSLDRYSSQFGLLCGFTFAQYKQRYKSTDESSKEFKSNYLYKMGIGLFFGVSIGVIAITAIIILRNVTNFGRNHANVFFSWLAFHSTIPPTSDKEYGKGVPSFHKESDYQRNYYHALFRHGLVLDSLADKKNLSYNSSTARFLPQTTTEILRSPK
ncbi:N-acetylneuraminate 9-O-acetyltransferase [Taenia solium]|eukprot:TsM_000711600 transcript=TsM_000711600 gene=TsM_000711600